MTEILINLLSVRAIVEILILWYVIYRIFLFRLRRQRQMCIRDRGLIRLGRRHLFPVPLKREEVERTIKEIVTACVNMSKKKIGALMGIKREFGLKNIIETGIILNAELSSQLLENIFFPSAPLHDGGVIIDGKTIVSCACLFPLSDNPNLEKTLGMRHRAAVGLSEHSDAIVVVVSEETGGISLAVNGQFTRNLSGEDLFTILKGLLQKEA